MAAGSGFILARSAFAVDPPRLLPDMAGVMREQGIPDGADVPQRIATLYREMARLYQGLTTPRAVWIGISRETCLEIFNGEGLNEPDTPLARLIPAASSLAVAVLTLGEPLSAEISKLGNAGDIAKSYMLDAIASYCAEKGAALLQELFLSSLEAREKLPAGFRVLMHSPGYCGWHVSGQRKLFQYADPAEIGVTLNNRYLMEPMKSISGVLVAGETAAHRFINNFPFCAHCRNRNCRERTV